MRTFAKLFARSPFKPLQSHMEKVAACVAMLPEVVEAFRRQDAARSEQLADEVSRLEHQADLVKNDIRNHLPRTLFLPIDRTNLLEILSLQDSLADLAEDLARLLTFKTMGIPPWLEELFQAFLAKNLECFDAAARIIDGIDELLEYAFSGAEAEKVKAMVDDVAFKEHEADLIQRELVHALFAHDQELSYSAFLLWERIVEAISDLSNLSENLANHIRLTLERK